jgi:hypothetical protein
MRNFRKRGPLATRYKGVQRAMTHGRRAASPRGNMLGGFGSRLKKPLVSVDAVRVGWQPNSLKGLAEGTPVVPARFQTAACGIFLFRPMAQPKCPCTSTHILVVGLLAPISVASGKFESSEPEL